MQLPVRGQAANVHAVKSHIHTQQTTQILQSVKWRSHTCALLVTQTKTNQTHSLQRSAFVVVLFCCTAPSKHPSRLCATLPGEKELKLTSTHRTLACCDAQVTTFATYILQTLYMCCHCCCCCGRGRATQRLRWWLLLPSHHLLLLQQP